MGHDCEGRERLVPCDCRYRSASEDANDATKRHLGGPGGIIVEDTITIYRPVTDVYSYWRNLENLPRFMDHLVEVRALDRFHSRWVARGPLGVRVEWDAEVINDIPPTLLSWKSMGDSDVVSAGSVRFKPCRRACDRGTREAAIRSAGGQARGNRGRRCLVRIRSIRSPRICAASSNMLETGEGTDGMMRRAMEFVGGARRLRIVRVSPLTSRARECDWTHSGPAHPRGGRPRSGERFDGARMRNVAAHPEGVRPQRAAGRWSLECRRRSPRVSPPSAVSFRAVHSKLTLKVQRITTCPCESD